MEKFVKLVESYRWRGSLPKEEFDETRSPVTHETGEQESVKSGCTESPPKMQDSDSSPSSPLLRNLNHDMHMQITRVDLGSVGVSKRPLSFSPGHCNRYKKKLKSVQNHPSRQLVFREENLGAKTKAEAKRKVKTKVFKKGSKKKKIELKQGGIQSALQVEPSSFPDLYSDSEVDLSILPVEETELTEHNEWKGGRVTSIKLCTRQCSRSPFFMHSKQKTRIYAADNNAHEHMGDPEVKNADVKTSVCRHREEFSVLQTNGNTIGMAPSASNHCGLSDREDSEEGACFSNFLDSSCSKAASGKKTSIYFAKTKALGQRDIAHKTWVPPVSVHGLIQEELYQDPWKVLVACMLLNKTSGKQMREIVWDLFALCPTPEAAVAVETGKIEDVIRGLGLQKKRARMIQRFSQDYLGKDWLNVGELHGIGKYATDAYAIFCEGRWQEVEPQDHKLVEYWQYLLATDGLGYAFKDDREKSDEIL